MRVDLTREIAGRQLHFALPLGALDRIAEVNPALEEVRDGLALPGPMGPRVWHLRELRAVIDAAGEAGGDRADFALVYEAIGIEAARALAVELLNRAFTDHADPGTDAGNAAAAREQARGSDSRSATT